MKFQSIKKKDISTVSIVVPFEILKFYPTPLGHMYKRKELEFSVQIINYLVATI